MGWARPGMRTFERKFEILDGALERTRLKGKEDEIGRYILCGVLKGETLPD